MKIRELLYDLKTTSASSDGKFYHPIRPQTAENFFIWPRIKGAWRVLTGKADVLDWEDWEDWDYV